MTLVPCETAAAITVHLREVTDATPINRHGSDGRTRTLCGMRVGWDVPMLTPRCTECMDIRAAREER